MAKTTTKLCLSQQICNEKICVAENAQRKCNEKICVAFTSQKGITFVRLKPRN